MCSKQRRPSLLGSMHGYWLIYLFPPNLYLAVRRCGVCATWTTCWLCFWSLSWSNAGLITGCGNQTRRFRLADCFDVMSGKLCFVAKVIGRDGWLWWQLILSWWWCICWKLLCRSYTIHASTVFLSSIAIAPKDNSSWYPLTHVRTHEDRKHDDIKHSCICITAIVVWIIIHIILQIAEAVRGDHEISVHVELPLAVAFFVL